MRWSFSGFAAVVACCGLTFGLAGLAGCMGDGTQAEAQAEGSHSEEAAAQPKAAGSESSSPPSDPSESPSEPPASLSEPPVFPPRGTNVPVENVPVEEGAAAVAGDESQGTEARSSLGGAETALNAAEPASEVDALESGSGAPPGSITLTDCFVELIEEAQVPAQEAGVLVKIMVQEGDEVQKGAQLAQIDDVQPRMQHEAAMHRYEAAREEAENDVNVRYSKAAAAVAEKEWEQAVEANRKTPGTVPEAEVERLRLKWREMELSIEQAEMHRRVAALDAKVAAAEVNAAVEGVKRRRITSPLDAMVVELYRHEGEWVQPGDPVVQVVRINRLRVEGVVNSAEAAGYEISGQPARVTVELARGRTVTLDGRVSFVHPVVRAGGKYEIWAEVENVQESGRWLLQPGLPATMTIQLKR